MGERCALSSHLISYFNLAKLRFRVPSNLVGLQGNYLIGLIPITMPTDGEHFLLTLFYASEPVHLRVYITPDFDLSFGNCAKSGFNRYNYWR